MDSPQKAEQRRSREGRMGGPYLFVTQEQYEINFEGIIIKLTIIYLVIT